MARTGEEWAERDAAIQWVIVTVIIALVVSYLLAIISFALTNLIPRGISQDNMLLIWKFVKRAALAPEYLLGIYWKWLVKAFKAQTSLPFYFWLPIIPFFSFFVILTTGLVTNPHSWLSTIHGSGRIATKKTSKNGTVQRLHRRSGPLARQTSPPAGNIVRFGAGAAGNR